MFIHRQRRAMFAALQAPCWMSRRGATTLLARCGLSGS